MTDEERRILNFYVAMYNNTNRRIEYLYENLDEIRTNIDNLLFNRRVNTLNDRINSPLVSRRPLNYNIPPVFNYNDGISNNENIRSLNTRNSNNIYRQNTISELFRNLDFLNELYDNNLTNEQIENSVRRIRFGDIEYPINISCPINLVDFDINDAVTQIIYCGHVFNTECINRWLETNSECPVCRFNLRINSQHSIPIIFRANEPTRINPNPNSNPNTNHNHNTTSNPNHNTTSNPNPTSNLNSTFNTNPFVNNEHTTNELFNLISSDNINTNNTRFSRLDPSNNIVFYAVSSYYNDFW